MGGNELWVDKYKPRTANELAVHKKKVEEIRNWLEGRLKCRKVADSVNNPTGSNVLMITGQTGVGKSATVQVLASQLGAELCEWTTPTPTLWQEHMHISYSGTKYTSKLEEFENFVEQTMKYQLLSSSSNGLSKHILLIDDLPVANGKIAYGRLSKCLHRLVQSAQVPTVILVTEYPKDEINDNMSRYWEGLEASFLRAGVCKVALNPVTANSIKKALLRICQEENCKISEESISLIAKASTGDIRHAITSLQYFCLGRNHPRSSALVDTSSCQSMETTDCFGRPSFSMDLTDNPLTSNFSLSLGRDENISLFHALGKFLHNKREPENAFGSDPFVLREKFLRSPLKLGNPENVIMQAHGQARPIADFLHENVLDFISYDAMDDAWVVASYLSDADFLLSTVSRPMRSRTISIEYLLDQIPQLAAASVAVRGVLFGNSQPSSTGWHSIRSPQLWQVENTSRLNKDQMTMERLEAYNSFSLCRIADMATEYKPAVRALGFRSLADANFSGDPLSDTDAVHNCYSGGSDDDEIEDWED